MQELVVGVEIGGTNTAIAFVKQSGKWLERRSLSTADFPMIDDFIAALTEEINEVMSGGLTQTKGLLLKPTERHFEQNLIAVYKGKVQLKRSHLNGQSAAILGALALVWSERW